MQVLPRAGAAAVPDREQSGTDEHARCDEQAHLVAERVGEPCCERRRQQQQRNEKKKEKPLTQEELDRQMDDYMLKNEKTATKALEDQMDAYWAEKKEKDNEKKAAAATADAPTAEEKEEA